LAGIFKHSFPDSSNETFCYKGVGIDTSKIGNKTFIHSVFDGAPADKAGLKFGDQILKVDDQPFHPITSFTGCEGETVSFSLIRNGNSLEVRVPVVKLDGRTMFEDALKSSVEIIKRKNEKIGYVHAWSYAGTQFQEELKSQILWGDLKNCDSLIVDLRDGWGGADINYLNLFRQPIAVVESTNATGEKNSYSGVWEKPVALLINERSTSGKELLSYGFKKLKLGKVIGENTAGAVVAGRCFPLSNGDILYLAVADIQVDGQRLEGQGITPDIRVRRPIKSAGDGDLQLEAAVQLLVNDQ
jgi:carboxyl-terminal processing protease